METQQSIKTYIDSKGLKQSHIAEKTGIKTDVLCNILNNKRKLLVDEYCIICEALEVPFDFFVKCENEILVETS